MFSVKKNVLQTVALLKAYGINQVVICPGSRNAPLIQTFSSDSFFDCHIIVDERNAGFYAIGIIQYTSQPVAVCCTSGSALLNLAPAVSEAYYQRLPLIVLSADRTPEWIGQMDGQTIPQPNVFGTLVKKAINLPEIKDETEEWYCNRLINEALIASISETRPVHINIPISEPLFDSSEEKLPQVRKINYTIPNKNIDIHPFVDKWNQSQRRFIIIGQQQKDEEFTKTLENLVKKSDCVVLNEHISNCNTDVFISNFDALLYVLNENKLNDYKPDLVIYAGGHITSKRLKHYLRQNKPESFWYISENIEVIDTFQSLTDLIEMKPKNFFISLSQNMNEEKEKPFYDLWKTSSEQIPEPETSISFSDLSVTGEFLKRLPNGSLLHLANSSTIRNGQLFNLDKSIKVYSNRGVNGIESTLPSTIGFASASDKLVYLLVGDLSFFYGLNALWNISHIKNLRILLINNGGGGIFHLLPGLNKSSSLKEYVSASHNTSAEKWIEASGLYYLSANNQKELENGLDVLMDEKFGQSIILEACTDMETSKNVFREYYHKIKSAN